MSVLVRIWGNSSLCRVLLASQSSRYALSRNLTSTRMPSDEPIVVAHDTKSNGRQKLVILGTGWASYAVLKNIDKTKYDVVVVSPRNHFLFTPLLCSTTVGTLEFRSVIEPVRNSKFRQTDHFLLSSAVSLDMAKQEVVCQSEIDPGLHYRLHYDKLAIGVGSVSNTFGVPGVHQHAIFLKELSDARKIRNRILNNFELAIQPGVHEEECKRLLHTVIVGGGPTGVEFGAELHDFVVQDVSRLYKQRQEDVKVSLVEARQILSSFDTKLQGFAEKKLKQRENFSLIKSNVTEVKEKCVTLQDGTVIPCGLVVWSTGLAPRMFTKQLCVEKNRNGQILVNQNLEVPAAPPKTVFALGDCSDIKEYPLPCTAQVAEGQGKYLAAQLNSSKVDHPPYTFKSSGMLAYIGGYEGVSDLPDRKIQGLSSWFLWRSAYLTKLGSWRLRMQVPLDWTKTILFGRDTSKF